MAIDPSTTTTVKVGELASAPFGNSSLIAHEVGGILKNGNLLDLANYVGSVVSVGGSVGFRDVQVTDGQTLPTTNQKEFILVGVGTFPNVGGGATITTTAQLNALVSNGTFWYIGVEIPISSEGGGAEISQQVRQGIIDLTPSEDAVFNFGQNLPFASQDHNITHEQGGSDEIQGQNLRVDVIPSVQNYSPVTNTLKGHLNGIDTKLGQLNTTTAGILNRIYFTGDVVNVNATNFYASSALGGGTVTSVVQTLSVDDNQKLYFPQDLLSVPFTAPTIGSKGNYVGQLTVMVNPNSANQEFGVEVYRTNNLGVPIASGVSGAPVGSLGVTVLSIISSGQLQLDANQLSGIQVSGMLASDVAFNTGERIRYRVYARKVGTAGGAINMSVYYGSSYKSYYDTPAENTTDSVVNKSAVAGLTATDALNSLLASKVNRTGIENSLPILDFAGNNLGAIETNDDHVSLKGVTGVLLDAPSAVVSSLAGFTEYLVGIGLDGQLIPVKRDSGLYAPTASNATVQNLVANTPTKMLAIITTTQEMTSPTLQWSINYTNNTTQVANVRIKLGINNVATGTGILYTVPKQTTLVITGASPYAPTIPSGTEVSAFIESSVVASVNSVTIKLDSGVSALQLKTVGGQSLFGTGNITEVQNSLTASSILAPSVDIMNTALAGKQNTLTNPITGTGVSGQVSFWNGTATQTGDSGLFWDNTNKRLGIGINAPNSTLHVSHVGNAPLGFAFTIGDQVTPASITGIYLRSTTQANISWGTGGFIAFNSNGGSSERMRITNAGRVLFGTTTDNLTDLVQINGSAIANAWKVSGGLVTQYQTGTGTIVDFNTSVRGATLTGFVSGAGTVAATDTILQAINKLNGNDALKAPLASPALTGVPTAPTATAGDNTTQIATTAFVLANTNANAVLLTGDQNITGTKTFINTATTSRIVMSTQTGATLSSLSLINQAGATVPSFLLSASTAGVGGKVTVTSGTGIGMSFESNQTGGGGTTATMLNFDNVLVNNDITPIRIKKQGVEVAKIDYLGVITATAHNLSALNTAPASATATGTLGEIRVTATHIYVCTATNTWVRTALTTW